MIIPMFLTIVAPESNIDVSGAIDTAWEGAEGLATYADTIWAKIRRNAKGLLQTIQSLKKISWKKAFKKIPQ